MSVRAVRPTSHHREAAVDLESSADEQRLQRNGVAPDRTLDDRDMRKPGELA